MYNCGLQKRHRSSGKTYFIFQVFRVNINIRIHFCYYKYSISYILKLKLNILLDLLFRVYKKRKKANRNHGVHYTECIFRCGIYMVYRMYVQVWNIHGVLNVYLFQVWNIQGVQNVCFRVEYKWCTECMFRCVIYMVCGMYIQV